MIICNVSLGMNILRRACILLPWLHLPCLWTSKMMIMKKLIANIYSGRRKRRKRNKVVFQYCGSCCLFCHHCHTPKVGDIFSWFGPLSGVVVVQAGLVIPVELCGISQHFPMFPLGMMKTHFTSYYNHPLSAFFISLLLLFQFPHTLPPIPHPYVALCVNYIDVLRVNTSTLK